MVTSDVSGISYSAKTEHLSDALHCDNFIPWLMETIKGISLPYLINA